MVAGRPDATPSPALLSLSAAEDKAAMPAAIIHGNMAFPPASLER